MMTLHLRVADPNTIGETVREQIRAMDPSLPVFRMATLEDQLDSSFGATRQAVALSGSFGVLALVLSAVGVYGLTTFAVSAQTSEIGIRIAVGASPSHIAELVARRGLLLLCAGLALGLLCAYAFTRMFASLLVEVGPADVLTFLGAGALLTIAAVAAMYAPVRRAINLDPVEAIRHE